MTLAAKRGARRLSILGLATVLFGGCSEEPETSRSPWEIPESVEAPAGRQQYLQFAWDEFIALNWPAAGLSGLPDTAKRLGQEGRVVWETWKEPFDTFLDDAQPPPPWGEPDQIPKACGDLVGQVAEGRRVIRMASKVSGHALEDLLDERLQAVGGILADQRGKLARYEVRMDRAMFDYIVDNRLFNAEIQASFPIRWPLGSIELKASWRELTPDELQRLDETRKRYHVAEALLVDPPGERFDFPERDRRPCRLQQVALVGLHVVHKIEGHDPFVWATFEHVDNLTAASFHNPDCPTGCVSPLDPDQPVEERCQNCVPDCRNTYQYCPGQTKTQVTRQVPIPADLDVFNRRVQSENPLVRGTKWSYYQLVGVQYPASIDLPFDPSVSGERLLGNTTMETFNQTASSCVGCHSFARSTNPFNLGDFSWFVRRAKFAPGARHPFPPGTVLPGRSFPGSQPTPQEIVDRILDKANNGKNSYEKWGTWPKNKWNNFEIALLQPDGTKGPGVSGENPHGNFVRIFVNDVALDSLSAGTRKFPVGSIVVKENLPFRYVPDPANFPKPKIPREVWQPVVELTVMVKMEAGYFPEGGDWYYLKTAPPEPGKPLNTDRAGKATGCVGCHAWQGNGDFMLTYNFGDRPVIRTLCVDEAGNERDCRENPESRLR